MRVTLVSPFDPNPGAAARLNGHVGGVERVFAEVSQNLARRGHDVTVVCSTDGPSRRAVESGVHVVRQRRGFTVLRAPVVRLARHVPADSDLVHVPATYPFTTPPVLRRARALGVPSVLDFHFEPAPGTAFGRFAARAYRRVGPRAYPLADAVLVRSVAYAESAPSLARVDPARLQVVPNGIDTERFRADGPARDGEYLLFVGRLVPYKGLDVLLNALARHPVGLPLLVAGDGPERPRLEALARQLGVDARFLGHVPDQDLPALYRGAQLTVLPSVNRQEAFGIALLESMACGTPVVASDLPGVGELARRGGLVAPPGEPDLLADQILDAITPGALVRGEALAARIHEAYSWDAVTDRLLAVYERIVGPGVDAAPAAPESEVTTRADPGGHAVL